MYADSGSPRRLADELRAWSLVLPPTAGFTHLSAAELRGWWLPAPIPHPVFAAVGECDRHPHRRGLLVSRHPSRPDTFSFRGLRVTSGAETLLAAARDLGILDLVVMGDSALRLGHCTLDDLTAAAALRRRGARRLRIVVGLLDKRSESPWESLLRVLHRVADIPVEPQYKIYDRGKFVARADLWIVGSRRLHEYDGGIHRERDVHRRDLARDRRLVETGWDRMGFIASDVLSAAAIISSADALLGRPADPRRLARWQGLVADSLFGSAGRARVRRHWARTH